MEEYFPDFANATQLGKYLTIQEQKFIDSILCNRTDFKILDIGGGSGRFAIPLCQRGYNITVIDPSEFALKLLKEKNSSVSEIQGLGQYLPFKNESFDIVLVIESIENFKNKEQFLQGCRAVLKKDGILIVTMLNRSSYKMLHPHRKIRPTCYWSTYLNFNRLLYSIGFSVSRAYGFNWLPFSRTSNNSLIPILAMVERLFLLNWFVWVSPWVIAAGKKI